MKAISVVLPPFGIVIPDQGGVFAAILRGPLVDGVEHPPFALIVASQADGEFKSAWGEYGKSVSATESRTDGKANTDAMQQAECPAAVKVRALSIDGHDDWYLPSLGELNSAAANTPELFSKGARYWTSTQASRNNAFVQEFDNGVSFWNDKDYERQIRACRRIPLTALAT